MVKKQESLFGDADKVYNVLHSERTIVNAEIKTTKSAISRLQTKAETLKNRKEETDEAIGSMEDHVKDKKPRKSSKVK